MVSGTARGGEGSDKANSDPHPPLFLLLTPQQRQREPVCELQGVLLSVYHISVNSACAAIKASHRGPILAPRGDGDRNVFEMCPR